MLLFFVAFFVENSRACKKKEALYLGMPPRFQYAFMYVQVLGVCPHIHRFFPVGLFFPDFQRGRFLI